MSEHGRVLAVNRVRLGSELVGDHAAGVSVLTVEDGADFDEDGGSLLIGDQVVTYSAANHIEADDTASLTLTATLTVAADDGDPVLLYDASRASKASEVYAQVELDGESGGDAIRALVAHHLFDALPEGIRGLVGESVLMAEDGDDWRVIDVLGLDGEASGPKWEDNDPHTLTAVEVTAGTFTHTLLHSRIVDHHEFLAMVNGVALGPDRFTLDADNGKVVVTLAGWETVADNFRFHYGYLRGPVAEPAIPVPVVIGTATSNLESVSFDFAALGGVEGDLVVVSAMGRDSVSTTDPRLTNDVTPGAPPGKVWWGLLTASTAPITLTQVDSVDARAATIAIYRGVTVAGASPVSGSGYAHAVAQFADSAAALVVNLWLSGTVAPGTSDTDGTGEWSYVVAEDWSRLLTVQRVWSASLRQTSPPGSFYHGGTAGDWWSVTLKLEAP